MGTAAAGSVLLVPGRLAKNPTDLTTAYPHGGTALGVVADVVLEPRVRTMEIEAEEWGGAPADVLYLGEAWRLAVLLRQWDVDAIDAVFPNVTNTGTGNVRRTIQQTGSTVYPGYTLSSRAMKLVFTPDDSARPGLLIQRALPALRPTAALNLGLGEELGFAAFFWVLKGANARYADVGTLADLAGYLT